MPKAFDGCHPRVFLLTSRPYSKVSGDAVVRMAIYKPCRPRSDGALYLWRGTTFGLRLGSLNLAPLEFGQVVGLYIATLFIVWQVINYVAFRSLPTTPIVLGGSLIVAGGVIVTFWKPA